MKVINNIEQWKNAAVAATTGFFDGVHLGHRFLINELNTIARKNNIPSTIVTFPSHPRQTLQSTYQPALLNTFEEKLELLASTGIDYVFVMDFTQRLASYSASRFITEVLNNDLNVKVLLVGYDHQFGRLRSAGFEDYVRYGKECGIEVVKAKPLTDASGMAISSSAVRRLLQSGDVDIAAKMLGYAYRLQGYVVEGFKRGRTLGFPTANIKVNSLKVIPKSGSYAVWVIVDNKRYMGMLYIGSRPTFINPSNETISSIEVNLFDFSDWLYDKTVTVEFVKFVRDDTIFDSSNSLKKQLEKDRKAVELALISEQINTAL